MITSIKIAKEFDALDRKKYEYDSSFLMFYRDIKGNYYPIPSLPVGLELNTDSSLVVIVGDNGSGKSTLLRRLLGQCKSRYFDECQRR